MASIRFEVEKYQITMGPDLPTVASTSDETIFAIIGCYGKNAQLMINFVADTKPLPLPLYDETKRLGAIFVPISLMQNYVDLLRNEKPVFARCDSEKPEWNSISTEHEQIGESE